MFCTLAHFVQLSVHIRVFRKTTFFELRPGFWIYGAVGWVEPTKKFQRYRPINDPGMAIWSFDLFYNVKTAEIGAKIFKIKNDQKSKMTQNQKLPKIRNDPKSEMTQNQKWPKMTQIQNLPKFKNEPNSKLNQIQKWPKLKNAPN